MDFPRDTRPQQIGREAEATAAALISKRELGLAYRPTGNLTDWGIDAEIEIVSGVATNALVKAQIKGTENVAALRDTGTQSVAVKPTTWNYWAACPLAVVVLLVDVTTDDVWWTIPPRAFGTGRTAVTFGAERCARVEPERFAGAIRSAASAPVSAQLLDHVSFFVDEFKDLWESKVDHDFWGAFGERNVGRLAAIYHHVDLLRALMGLEERLFPWTWWLSRSRVLTDANGWDDDYGLLQVVAEEAIAYVFPRYVEALVVAGEVAALPRVLMAHPQLATLASRGLLEEDALLAYLHPYTNDPDLGVSVAYRVRDYEGIEGVEFQDHFANVLRDLGVRRL